MREAHISARRRSMLRKKQIRRATPPPGGTESFQTDSLLLRSAIVVSRGESSRRASTCSREFPSTFAHTSVLERRATLPPKRRAVTRDFVEVKRAERYAALRYDRAEFTRCLKEPPPSLRSSGDLHDPTSTEIAAGRFPPRRDPRAIKFRRDWLCNYISSIEQHSEH